MLSPNYFSAGLLLMTVQSVSLCTGVVKLSVLMKMPLLYENWSTALLSFPRRKQDWISAEFLEACLESFPQGQSRTPHKVKEVKFLSVQLRRSREIKTQQQILVPLKSMDTNKHGNLFWRTYRKIEYLGCWCPYFFRVTPGHIQ